jgi:hypothetical protein
MEFLNENQRVKKKYYAIYKYIMNDFKERNNTMQRILAKHKSQFFVTLKIRNNKILILITQIMILVLILKNR